jgi:hypothetical protein
MKICPKCKCLRADTDLAPEWQCPSCGIAYHKIAIIKAEEKEKDRKFSVNKKIFESQSKQLRSMQFKAYAIAAFCFALVYFSENIFVSVICSFVLSGVCIYIFFRVNEIGLYYVSAVRGYISKDESPNQFKLSLAGYFLMSIILAANGFLSMFGNGCCT